MLSKLNDELTQQWQKNGYEMPTAIQEKVFEVIAKGEHVVAISPTGTGKTLAYVLPLLNKIEKNGELQLLIFAPTQELAQQIAQVIRDWASVRVQVIAGGANVKRQLEQLKNRPEIIVATPGRLDELAKQSKKIKFHQIKAIVVDEADYLLQDEHMQIVRNLIKRAPGQVQKLFFSATRNEALQQVEKWFGVSPKVIQVTEDNRTLHGYLVVEERKRVDMLKKLTQDISQALVFVKNVAELNMMYEKLVYEKVPVGMLSSDMHHIARKEAVTQFKNKALTYLLTTDVAARGIDIADLECVIQMSVPREKEMYTHRSGRTGRMGKEGVVLNIVSQQHVKELQKLVSKQYQLHEVKFKNGQLLF